MSRTNPEADAYFDEAREWKEEFAKLRTIVLSCGLTEELKWRQACYTFENGNVVIISGFKDYCALGFFKGALLKDPDGLLVAPGKHSQSQRQIRFTAVGEIIDLAAVLKAYVQEAVEVERAGLRVKPRKTSEYTVPEEFKHKLDEMPALKVAFDALTPGRQRAYILYFSGAKQSKTRESRVERWVPQILAGKGMNDRREW